MHTSADQGTVVTPQQDPASPKLHIFAAMSSSSEEAEFDMNGDDGDGDGDDDNDNDNDNEQQGDDNDEEDAVADSKLVAVTSSSASNTKNDRKKRKRKETPVVTNETSGASSEADDDDDPPLSSLKPKTKAKATTKLRIRVSRSSRSNSNNSNNNKKPKLENNDEEEEDPDGEENQDMEEEDDEDGDFDASYVSPVKSKATRKAKAEKSNKRNAKKAAKPDATTAAKTKASKKKQQTTTATVPGSTQPRELKKLDRTERLTYAMQSFLWWDAVDPPAGCQWVTMEHAGVAFPEPYQPHGVRMNYDGKPVMLTPEQEEAATFFAATDPEGMHLGNPTTAKIFIKNFFEDFKAILGPKHIIQTFEQCDFATVRSHLEEQKIVRKAATDQERKSVKEDKSQALLKYGYAIVDGHLERVGNFNMEPPGTFRGRGVHPKMGRLKSRVMPEQVSLNLSECAPVPICHVKGHAWGDIRHDPRGQWLATWKENINHQVSPKNTALFGPAVRNLTHSIMLAVVQIHAIGRSIILQG
jgi:DNA topoisomerase IB